MAQLDITNLHCVKTRDGVDRSIQHDRPDARNVAFHGNNGRVAYTAKIGVRA